MRKQWRDNEKPTESGTENYKHYENKHIWNIFIIGKRYSNKFVFNKQ